MVAAVLVGVCVGFLPHNFSPARIFMGDSGSMLIGLLLASTTITLTGTVDPNAVDTDLAPALLPLLLPIAVMALPFLDLAARRRPAHLAGRSPFAPDKQHLHHRLLESGHSHARAVLVMYLWSAVIAFGVTAVAFPLATLTLLVSVAAVVARRDPGDDEHPAAAPGGGHLHRPATGEEPVTVRRQVGVRALLGDLGPGRRSASPGSAWCSVRSSPGADGLAAAALGGRAGRRLPAAGTAAAGRRRPRDAGASEP